MYISVLHVIKQLQGQAQNSLSVVVSSLISGSNLLGAMSACIIHNAF